MIGRFPPMCRTNYIVFADHDVNGIARTISNLLLLHPQIELVVEARSDDMVST